jgi:UDP-N-acetylglucosamine transferase subunit ALG13
MISSFISKFNECWIPDFEQLNGLAGKLSHPPELPSNAVYIGTLSRFAGNMGPEEFMEVPFSEILVLLSGPEPQRSILEKRLVRQLENTDLKATIIRGVTEQSENYYLTENIRVFSHLETPLMKAMIRNAFVVISRPGYSSIMDLTTLGKRAIFIPTPGQTEQEYLSRYLMDKKIYFSMAQDEFDLFYALEMANNYPGMVLENDYSELERRIAGLR